MGVALGIALPFVDAPGGAAATGEPEEMACPVVASAQGVQLMTSKGDDLFLQEPTGAGVPVAQACVDYGLGVSIGFASNPYPGETVVAVPPTARGATELPVPDYPAYASSAYPSEPESKTEAQGYSLFSRSSETSSEARARSGLVHDAGAGGSTVVEAKSEVDPESRSSAATATSDTEPLTINDVLRLGRVHSVASVQVGADGKAARRSQLRIGRTEVGGQVVEITPDGVSAAGRDVPLAESDPTEVLEAAGVRVRYLAEETTPRGVLSAGVVVTAQHEVNGSVFTTQYTFGRAFAAADVVEARAGGADEGDGLLGATPDGAPPGGDAEPEEGAAASGLDSGPAPGGSAPTAPDGLAEADPESAPAPAVAAPSQAGFFGDPEDMGMAGLYLVIVFGAMAMFASGMLLRLLGVKTRWIS